MILQITNDFGTFRLRDPEIVPSAMFGQLLRGEYEWGEDCWVPGAFRTDRIIDSQIEPEFKTLV